MTLQGRFRDMCHVVPSRISAEDHTVCQVVVMFFFAPDLDGLAHEIGVLLGDPAWRTIYPYEV